MQKPCFLKNETHKILWDSEIQTDYLISARWPDIVIINKKRELSHKMDFAIPADQRVIKKAKKRQVLRPYQRTEKAVEH